MRFDRRVPAAFLLFIAFATGGRPVAAAPLSPGSGTLVLDDYRFDDGETLPNLRLHWLTLGAAARSCRADR